VTDAGVATGAVVAPACTPVGVYDVVIHVGVWTTIAGLAHS
jgi:hypothetical protein